MVLARIFKLIVALCLGYLPLSNLQADITVHVGPAAAGGGGPNPLSIPPINPIEYEVVWLTPSKNEFSIGIVPGIFYGQRLTHSSGLYFSMGAGLAIDGNGSGPGVYSAFGFDLCGNICFNMEYKKAVGLSTTLIQPYALRIGVTFYRN